MMEVSVGQFVVKVIATIECNVYHAHMDVLQQEYDYFQLYLNIIMS